jgi:hypothetical protein
MRTRLQEKDRDDVNKRRLGQSADEAVNLGNRDRREGWKGFRWTGQRYKRHSTIS